MGETVPYHDGVEQTVYEDEPPGNGDPIVAVPVRNDRALKPIMLGTGFSSWDQVASEIAHAVETSESTRNINPMTARNLYGVKPEAVKLFSMASSVEFSIKEVEAEE